MSQVSNCESSCNNLDILYLTTLKESIPLIKQTSATKKKQDEDVMRLLPLMPCHPPNLHHRAHQYILTDARAFVIDNEALYQKFYNKVLLPTGKSCSLAVKENNTIMDWWPFILKGGKDLEAERMELRASLRIGNKGYALYVE